MPYSAQDVSTQELSSVAVRMAGQLSAREAMPWFALQYRLSEVGQRRTEPRVLSRVAKELRGQPQRFAPDEQVCEPSPGVFLRPGLIEVDGQSVVKRVTEQLEEIHAATIISLPPDAFVPEGTSVDHVTQNLYADGNASGYKRIVLSTTADFEFGGDKWSLWFCNDLKWIYPDDPRLFAHLHYCAERQLRPIIVARKIAPPSFVFFKAVGVFGVEFYAHVVRDGTLDRLRVLIEDLGWVNTITVRTLRAHAFRRRVDAALQTTPLHWERAGRLLQAHPPHKILKAKDNSPRALLEWVETPGLGLDMPDRWKQTVARWALLEARRKSRKAGDDATSRANDTARPTESDNVKANEQPSPEPQLFGRGTEKSRVPIRIW
jgi:hypothetical protein